MLFELLVCASELDVLRVVVVRRLHIEGQWDSHLKRVDAHGLVVGADVEEEGLLIGEVVIVIEAVIDEGGHVSQWCRDQHLWVKFQEGLLLHGALARGIRISLPHDGIIPPLLVFVIFDTLEEFVVLRLPPLGPNEVAPT